MQSEAKHTPEPWTWAPVHDEEGQPRITVMATPFTYQPGIVQHIAFLASWGKWNADEVIANADLLTAAPDLLAACIAAEDAILDRLGRDDPTPGIVDTLRAAIRKATGNALRRAARWVPGTHW